MASSPSSTTLCSHPNQGWGFQLDLFSSDPDCSWISWPRYEDVINQFNEGKEHLRNSKWTTPLSLGEWSCVDSVYDAICQAIAAALSNPCPVFIDGKSTRIEFMGCVAWIVDFERRTIRFKTRTPRAAWKASSRATKLYWPLEDYFWLDVIIQRWVSPINGAFGSRANEATWNIQSALAYQLYSRADWLAPTTRQLRHHFNVSPNLLSLIQHLGSWSREFEINNENYSMFWREEETWLHLATYYSDLAHFYYLLRKEGLLESSANISGLRAKCFQLGMTKAGWRFLCKHGVSAYEAYYSDFDTSLAYPTILIAYINWQADAGLKRPLQKRYARRVHESNCIVTREGGKRQVILDPRLAQIGNELASQHPTEDFNDAGYWGVLRNWTEVLQWVVDTQPHFDRNQFTAGWKAIYRSYQSGLISQKPALAWEPVLGSFRYEQWWIKELTKSTEFKVESSRMHHCAVTYVEDCSDRKYVMFTVEKATDNSPAATIGFEKKGDKWSCDQVKGKFNSDPGPDFAQLVDVITNKFSELAVQSCPKKSR